MTDRKILIIEKAAELFAEKGFDATSVQDITDACGISKGSFYLSFKSKDNLLFSIFEYFTNKLMKRMAELKDINIEARERLKLFFKVQFEEIARYSDFILMQMREQTNPINEEMLQLMNNMRRRTYQLQEDVLLDVYGEKVERHLPDLHVLLHGILTGYIEIIIFNKDSLNYEALAKFLVARTDSIVAGLTEPLLRQEQLIGFEIDMNELLLSTSEIIEEIRTLKQERLEEDIQISLDVIEEELLSETVRKPVILGMISNLKEDIRTEKVVRKLQLYLKNL
ncbi:TetR/AcrR family transcriptional regulator [Sporosarcina pasteurii]|uniref:HTH-type transcriptional repressor KstR2 n=1 Tax=Sporosarcina pasteurii TaxID=1474 RepID=A0A380C6M7_SPOPA|nr:TetR/AcrR family transcriptional regulator [Sporosarcina pasteurii]MDS9471808.1 helix-turn-helix domain-containing protein [Sporosarcina pasteurii]QBQ04600.1 TetR/AcrR family transcriptional regulator [Sporosarcina pasteurii]SUJ13930.1 HTH-type transcriptional repressor KstR2 [Sporosarcina pasteurii]